MHFLIRLLRYPFERRFKPLELATIEDIPTDKFNTLIDELVTSGWKQTYTYQGFDAWIDYGMIKLRKNGVQLTLEWDNWLEGRIEGPAHFIERFANEHDLPFKHEWRRTSGH